MPFDDDDEDLFATKAGTTNLGALLELPRLEDPVSPGQPGAAPRPPSPPEPEFEPSFGDPSADPLAAAAYFWRVYVGQGRMRERASVLRVGLSDDRHQLDEAHAALGRAAYDLAEREDVPFPAEVVAEVRAAASALDELHEATRREREARRARAATASVAKAGATTALTPFEAAQEAAQTKLDRAHADREALKGRVAVAEGKFAEAATAGADAMRDADRAIDEARHALREAEVVHREAALAYAEARRRTIEQMSRLAAADDAMEGLAIEERRAAKEAQRREDQALRRLRDAYVKLGVRIADEPLAHPGLESARNGALRVRKKRSDTEALVEQLRRRAGKIEPEAYAKGRLVAAALACVPVVIGLVILAV